MVCADGSITHTIHLMMSAYWINVGTRPTQPKQLGGLVYGFDASIALRQ